MLKKGVFHTHTLDKAGSVLIVENQNTCDENSPTRDMTEEQIEVLKTLFANNCTAQRKGILNS